tara:strand:+ start:36260 stop:39784 length:3525 start_codon:yes stop_codon:yes gene_type:complete
MKKHFSLLLVPIYLVSCVSNPVAQSPRETPTVNLITNNDNIEFEFLRLSDCAEKNANRSPSAQTKCLNFYEVNAVAPTKKEVDVISEIAGKTRVIEQFGQTENLGLWAMYFGSGRVRDMIKGDSATSIHPVEFISEKQIKSISAAWRTLRDIPDNKFTLSQELVLDVNRLLMGDVETSVIQDLNSRITDETQKATGLKRMAANISNYFKSAPGFRTKGKREEFEQVKDADFAIYKANAEAVGGRVIEAADSVADARVFTVEAPKGQAAQIALGRVLEETNRKIENADSASYAEKVAIAADLHLKLAALKPMNKLNDLTVQMVVNRALIQMGLDPAVQVPVDLSMSREKVAELYRDGIVDYLSYTQRTFDIKLNKEGVVEIANEAVAITGRGAGLRVKVYGRYAHKYPKAVALMRDKDRVTPLDGRMLQLGKNRRTFVLKDDGFLYDGIIPHTVREENGQLKLYPISDMAYRLLGLNGQLTGEDSVRREITIEHQAQLKQNLAAIERLLQNKVKPEDFEIVYDKNTLQANKTGGLYLYEWQITSLERAAKIKEDPKENPYAVLIPSRGDPFNSRMAGRSSFEQNYFKGSRGTKIGDLIGQYEQRDLDYNQLAREVKRNTSIPEARKAKILKDIMDSRRKLHLAAREILRPLMTKYLELSSVEKDNLRDNATFYQLEDYLRNFSKLWFESLDQAIAKFGDDHVYVQRVQTAGLTNFLGFRSQTELGNHPLAVVLTLNGMLVPQLREIYAAMKSPQEVDSVTEDGTVSKIVAQKIAAIAKGNKKIEAILASIVLRIYSTRAADIQSMQEFESVFMTHYLHAVNRGMKEGISTTADPTYLAMVKTYEQYSSLKIDDSLVAFFKEFKKDSKEPAVEAKQWIEVLAKKEKEKKLPLDYYELGWIGAFSKEFNIPMGQLVEFAKKNKSNNDKFTSQSDAIIYVLRIPVEEIDSNYASGYAAQFENTTRRGYGVIRSKWGVFPRKPVIQREYKGAQKFGVNLADLSEKGRAVYDMTQNHIESKPDFTPYLVYTAGANKHQGILAGLTSSNKKLYAQSVKALTGLKYDLQTLKSEQDVAGFKQLIEDVFNGAIKAIETRTGEVNADIRKELINSLAAFLKEHGQRDERVAGWVAELWEGVIPVKGADQQPVPVVGKDVVRKAKIEAAAMKKIIGAPVAEEPAS